MDKRITNGGTRVNSGRKPKIDEQKLIALGKGAIIAEYSSEDKFWKHIAKQSKDSTAHLKMILEYVYGKPKETQELTINKEEPLFIINVTRNDSDTKAITTNKA